MTEETVNAVAITDNDGNLYLVPQWVMERSKIAPEDQEAVKAAFGIEDASGFMMGTIGLPQPYYAGRGGSLGIGGGSGGGRGRGIQLPSIFADQIAVDQLMAQRGDPTTHSESVHDRG